MSRRADRLATLCGMSTAQFQAFLPMKMSVEMLKTFDDAEAAFLLGCISQEEWLKFCYDWRDQTFRFSDLGKREAAQYSEKTGLPAARSDAKERVDEQD